MTVKKKKKNQNTNMKVRHEGTTSSYAIPMLHTHL